MVGRPHPSPSCGRATARSSSAPSTGGISKEFRTNDTFSALLYAHWYYSQRPRDARVERPEMNYDTYLILKSRMASTPEAPPLLVEDHDSCSSRDSHGGRSSPSSSKSPRQAEPPLPAARRRTLNGNAAPFVPSGLSSPATPLMDMQEVPRSFASSPSTPLMGPMPFGGQPLQLQGPKPFGRQRSKLLDELRSRGRNPAMMEVRELLGQIVEFSMDQEGSRLVQRKLEACSAEEKEEVFNEIKPHALTLMTDVFGNYVLQKVLEHGTQDIRREIAQCMKGNILELTLQTYGCRIVQKGMEVFPQSDRDELARELDGHVPRCVQDQNGNHVIQKCIECMPSNVGFIVQAFVGRVTEFATHAYGCRCVQRILEHCKDHTDIVPVLEEILHSIHNLVTDQYGNYVVQHVLINGHPQYQFAITSKLRGYYTMLATHKFASNVVEKLFEFATPQMRGTMLQELITHRREDGFSGLVGAVTDQYGNYVMQKVFDWCDEGLKAMIINHLRPSLLQLRKSSYGKHFIMRLEKQGFLGSSPASAPLTPPSIPSRPGQIHGRAPQGMSPMPSPLAPVAPEFAHTGRQPGKRGGPVHGYM